MPLHPMPKCLSFRHIYHRLRSKERGIKESHIGFIQVPLFPLRKNQIIRSHISQGSPKYGENYMYEDDVLRLDVPMNDALSVQITKRLQQSPYHKRNSLFLEPPPLLEDIIQLPVRPQLHECIHKILIRKDRVQFDDVLMRDKRLDFEFSDEFLLKLTPLCLIFTTQLLLIENLECPKETGLFMPELEGNYMARKTVPCLPLPNCLIILNELMVKLLLWLLGLTLSSVSLSSSSLPFLWPFGLNSLTNFSEISFLRGVSSS